MAGGVWRFGNQQHCLWPAKTVQTNRSTSMSSLCDTNCNVSHFVMPACRYWLKPALLNRPPCGLELRHSHAYTHSDSNSLAHDNRDLHGITMRLVKVLSLPSTNNSTATSRSRICLVTDHIVDFVRPRLSVRSRLSKCTLEAYTGLSCVKQHWQVWQTAGMRRSANAQGAAAVVLPPNPHLVVLHRTCTWNVLVSSVAHVWHIISPR
jgi:hypothetical protein